MNTNELFSQKQNYFKHLEENNMCENTLWVNQYVINNFQKYCSSKRINIIGNEVINNFYSTELDYINKSENYQYVLKRPLLAFIDFYNNKGIRKKYAKEKNKYIINNKIYKEIFNDYFYNTVLKQNITERSKNRKKRVIIKLLNYLDIMNIKQLNDLSESPLIKYINVELNNYSQKTKSLYKGILNEFFTYLYDKKYIKNYSYVFINKKTTERKPVANSFTEKEVKQILDSIDTSTKSGKQHYLIFCLLSYYGLRIGDVLNLKLSNIDFENNTISIIQKKTKVPLTLPLIDEVKFALLDYLKYGRPNNTEEECIILTIHAPYTKYQESITHQTIRRIIKNSGVDFSNKVLGSRVFRHSIATNMINDNIELYKISSILGHTNTRTTSNYITRDIKHLKEITLEVKNGK